MKTLHDAWCDMMKATYGERWFHELSNEQQADMKRAFMAGALTFMVDWVESTPDANHVAQHERELDNFANVCEDDNLCLLPWSA